MLFRVDSYVHITITTIHPQHPWELNLSSQIIGIIQIIHLPHNYISTGRPHSPQHAHSTTTTTRQQQGPLQCFIMANPSEPGPNGSSGIIQRRLRRRRVPWGSTAGTQGAQSTDHRPMNSLTIGEAVLSQRNIHPAHHGSCLTSCWENALFIIGDQAPHNNWQMLHKLHNNWQVPRNNTNYPSSPQLHIYWATT